MIFAENCYAYNITRRKQESIRKRIRRHKPIRNLYLIIMPMFSDGMFEIYAYNQLLQKFYKRLDDHIRVVGISKGREQADILITEIIQDIYDFSGEEWKVEEYFFADNCGK